MATKTGQQTPTASVVIPYSKTKGNEAVKLYAKAGRKLEPWQASLVKDMMAYKGKLWVHISFGYAVPRRNGKSESVLARALWGLENGEHVLYTAHRTSTSHSAWQRMIDLLNKLGYQEKEDFRKTKQLGFETIEHLKSGGIMNFRTRTTSGGLGEGYDLLIIDEAQEYTNDQASALTYITSASQNPQTIYLGTPPTPQSSGTEFKSYRTRCLEDAPEGCGWAEWSVENQSDPMDTELWYKVNPALGLHLTERTIRSEYKGDDVDFNIQRLGLWLKHDLKSAISQPEWEALACKEKPKKGKTLFVGIKFGVDGKNVAMSVAFKTTEGKIFVEGIDCAPVRDGFGWILRYLEAMNARKVVVDGASGQRLLQDAMKQGKLHGYVAPTVGEIVSANARFEQGVFNGLICHMNQPALTAVVGSCTKRAIGNKGGFGYKALKDGLEIALMDSMILAYWACSEDKEKRIQRINY